MRFPTRRAVTLVESLVIIAIMGVLAGLLMCAVQQVRSAADRSRCQNNLRQVGLALHNHHDAQRAFPSGCRGGADPQPYMSWMTRLLPYLEMRSLWQDALQAFSAERFFERPPHWAIISRPIPLFVCPSDGRFVTDVLVHTNVGLTSYQGVDGRSTSVFDGVLYLDSAVRLGDVTDGASTTLAAGERPSSKDGRLGWWYAGWGQDQTGVGDLFLGVRERDIFYRECPSAPNHFGPGTGSNCDTFHFWSRHPGGGHFVFCDGSVRFLAYSADSVMPALATRAGGEPVTVPD